MELQALCAQGLSSPSHPTALPPSPFRTNIRRSHSAVILYYGAPGVGKIVYLKVLVLGKIRYGTRRSWSLPETWPLTTQTTNSILFAEE